MRRGGRDEASDLDDLFGRPNGGLSLLEAAAQLSDAEEELAVARHQSLLRRRFAAPSEHVTLNAGLDAMQRLVGVRTAALARLEQSSATDTLRSEVAEARAEADKQRQRAEENPEASPPKKEKKKKGAR